MAFFEWVEFRIPRNKTTGVRISRIAVGRDEALPFGVSYDVFAHFFKRRTFSFFFAQHVIVGLALKPCCEFLQHRIQLCAKVADRFSLIAIIENADPKHVNVSGMQQ